MGAAYLGVTVFIVVMVAALIPAIGEFARAIGEQGSDSVASLNEWTEDVFGVTVFDSALHRAVPKELRNSSVDGLAKSSEPAASR